MNATDREVRLAHLIADASRRVGTDHPAIAFATAALVGDQLAQEAAAAALRVLLDLPVCERCRREAPRVEIPFARAFEAVETESDVQKLFTYTTFVRSGLVDASNCRVVFMVDPTTGRRRLDGTVGGRWTSAAMNTLRNLLAAAAH